MKLVLCIAGALVLTACSSGSNIDARQAYWEKEIAGALQPGATMAQLEDFVKSHGQKLDCYQNQQREQQCDFDDNQSVGGTRTYPVRLSVIFKLKADVLASHQFTTTRVQR